MKSFLESLKANTILFLVLGYLSIVFYYNWFSINISSRLEVSEILLLAMPSFKYILTSLFFVAPYIFMLGIGSFFKPVTPKSESGFVAMKRILEQAKSQGLVRVLTTRSKIALSLFTLIVIYNLCRTMVMFCRIALSIIYGTEEFYMHPTSMLTDINQNNFFFVSLVMSLVLVWSLFTSKIPDVVKSLIWSPTYKWTFVIVVTFLITIYYRYAEICRITDEINYKSFTLSTNLEKGIYKSPEYQLIGATKNFYFLKKSNEIITLKASSIILESQTDLKNPDNYNLGINYWNISYWGIMPPSLSKKQTK
jgi:hypothetical protein